MPHRTPGPAQHSPGRPEDIAALPPFIDDPSGWTHLPVSALVRYRAAEQPDAPAYHSPAGTTTWAGYDALADAVRDAVLALPHVPAATVYLPDTAVFHAAVVGLYRAGVLAAATGARSGPAELAHLAYASGSTVLVTAPAMRGNPADALADELRARGARIEHVLVVEPERVTVDGAAPGTPAAPARVFGVDDVSYLNATSGTTGLPKLVTHTQRRWATFAAIACRGARMRGDETIASFVPAPYGFGLWTAHFLPVQLGRPAVVTGRFDAREAVALIAGHGATVLGAVSTQFRMMLHADPDGLADLPSLRVMYTGGEAVPRAEAERFESVTGAKVLQFYGSNEAGGVSATTVGDDDATRLGTGGHVLPEAHVRILAPDTGREVPAEDASGLRRGRPAVRGPLISDGYWGDDAANRTLFTDDGWLLLGDLVEVDGAGRLRVVGRLADLIIRGGKNISAAEVEDLVREHPAVAMVAAVAVPDAVYGERLCAVITLVPGAALGLEELTSWLTARGATREYLPEKLVVVEEMPMAAGGKIAKARVRALAAGTAEEPDGDGAGRRR